ncbi:hypothetical protein [Aureimonas sp. N4]|uniref:hypothetical protein n=1 Tax=Aureimonas sp. N4 TaxID=1638165 RepID=UPI0007854FCA|nr:hypothetical protein [Aureimonas sp. N4]
MQLKLFLVATALALSAPSAEAQQMAFGKGVCEKFVLGRNNMTKECDTKLMNSTYDNGRTGFYFVFKRGSIITFSGMDRPNPTPDTDLFAIDKVIFSAGGATKEFAATGSCRYGNYKAGHKRIRCKGTSDDGQPFEAVFRLTAPPEG